MHGTVLIKAEHYRHIVSDISRLAIFFDQYSSWSIMKWCIFSEINDPTFSWFSLYIMPQHCIYRRWLRSVSLDSWNFGKKPLRSEDVDKFKKICTGHISWCHERFLFSVVVYHLSSARSLNYFWSWIVHAVSVFSATNESRISLKHFRLSTERVKLTRNLTTSTLLSRGSLNTEL